MGKFIIAERCCISSRLETRSCNPISLAADKITGAVNLPLFLLEGVAILAEVFAFLMLVL